MDQLDGASDKPRLTSEQKKKNHIESEKKRRDAIRAGFQKLSEIVPECEGQARSEAVILQKTVGFIREQLGKKEELKQTAMEKYGYSEGDFEQTYRDIAKAAEAAEEDDDDDEAPKASSSKTAGR